MYEYGVEKTIWIEENVTKTTCTAKWFNCLSNLKSARATNDGNIYNMPNICKILKLFLPLALDLALALAPTLTLSFSTGLCLWINNSRREEISMQYDSDIIDIIISSSSSNTIITVIVYVVVVVIVFYNTSLLNATSLTKLWIIVFLRRFTIL